MTRPDRKTPRRPPGATPAGGVIALLRHLIAQARYQPERHYMRGRGQGARTAAPR